MGLGSIAIFSIECVEGPVTSTGKPTTHGNTEEMKQLYSKVESFNFIFAKMQDAGCYQFQFDITTESKFQWNVVCIIRMK